MAKRKPRSLPQPSFVVDLRRCIGCHACSVACKTVHDVPLGEFRMRVRWLSQPSDAGRMGDSDADRSGSETYDFVPVFSESLCQEDAASTRVGLDPACVRACPTDALVFGDRADPSDSVSQLAKTHETKTLHGPEATDLKESVRYIGLADWIGGQLHRGAALDPRDTDPIYEQPPIGSGQ